MKYETKKKNKPDINAVRAAVCHHKAKVLYRRTGLTYAETLKHYILAAGGPYKLAKKTGIPLATVYAALGTRSLEKMISLCVRIAESIGEKGK